MGHALEIRAAKRLTLIPKSSADWMNEPFHARLRELVSIHNAMFQRLLFERPSSARELADLFHDIGKTYLEISEGLRKNENGRPEKDRG